VSSPSGSRIITIIVGVIAFIGVSSSVSPWLDAFYSAIVIWVVGGLAVALVIYAAVKIPDVALRREVRASWTQNGAAVRAHAEEQHRRRSAGSAPPRRHGGASR
jgi:Flp pilus assembly pilin Flp